MPSTVPSTLIGTKQVFYWIFLHTVFVSESEVASGAFLFIRLTRAKLLSGTNDGSIFKSTNFTAR